MDPKTFFEPYIEPKHSPLGPKKIENNPNIKSKLNVRIEGNKEKKKLLHYMSRPQKEFNLTLTLPYSYENPISSFIQC